MPRLNINQRHRALAQLDAGAAVAANFGVDARTISRLVSRYRQTNSVNDRPRSGRPRVTTANQDRQIRLTHLRQRFRPATLTAHMTPGRHNPRINRSTVRRRLRAANLRSRRPYTVHSRATNCQTSTCPSSVVSPTSALASTSVAKRIVQRQKTVPVRRKRRSWQGMVKNWRALY